MNIGFLADKGGVGKTTLAYHTAVRFNVLERDVCLVDLDRRSASSSWLSSQAQIPVYTAADLRERELQHGDVIWDTPAHPDQRLRELLIEACDLLVVVSEPSPVSHIAAVELCRGLLKAGGKARILINLVRPTSNMGLQVLDALDEAGIPCFRTLIRQYACYQHAHWDGRAVCDWTYPSADQAWSDVSRFCTELLEKQDGQ